MSLGLCHTLRIRLPAMEFDEIMRLRTEHPAWVLLRSSSAALVLAFLNRVFVEANAGNLPGPTLAAALDEELYALNERLGENGFPKSAKAYLDDWSAPERGWLRKFYVPGSDGHAMGLIRAAARLIPRPSHRGCPTLHTRRGATDPRIAH